MAEPFDVAKDQRVIEAADALGRATLSAAADEQAASLMPVLRAIQSTRARTLDAICCALNERKIRTARGARWHVSSVSNLLARAQKFELLR